MKPRYVVDIYAAEMRALRLLIKCCGNQLASPADRAALASLERRIALGDRQSPPTPPRIARGSSRQTS